MIVYKGHPDFEFVYACSVRGANYGILVGRNRWSQFEEPLPHSAQKFISCPHLIEPGLTEFEITATTLDGDGVFHGKPRLSMARAGFGRLNMAPKAATS